jgi:hypothetical protein
MSAEESRWKLEAKCFNDPFIQEQLKQVRSGNGYDPFFPPKGSNPAKWANSYCGDCPVRLACLAEALKSLNGPAFDWLDGIWGGTTIHKRHRSHRQQQERIQQIVAQLKALSPDSDNPIAS